MFLSNRRSLTFDRKSLQKFFMSVMIKERVYMHRNSRYILFRGKADGKLYLQSIYYFIAYHAKDSNPYSKEIPSSKTFLSASRIFYLHST